MEIHHKTSNNTLSKEDRKWIVSIIKDYYIIIIAARLDYQKIATIEPIKGKLNGWIPNEIYFQEEND